MSTWIRQTHRWLSLAFTACVLANIVVNFVISVPKPLVVGVGLFTLLPLALLMVTGLYLFVLPYATRWRAGPTIVEARRSRSGREKRASQ
jgi:quinol-cytochrome oxidoreductase complex cytochrome b subunit